MSSIPPVLPDPPTQNGVFGPDMLALLNNITQQMQNLEQQRAAILSAYAAGAKMGQGRFNWNPVTGVWTFTPTPASPNGSPA